MTTGTLVTNLGKLIALNRTFLASPTYTAPANMKAGTGVTAPSAADTNLTASVITKAITLTSFDDPNLNVTTQGVLLTTEANGNTISEFGLVNSDGTPKLFSHAVFMGIVKNASVQIIFTEKDQIT